MEILIRPLDEPHVHDVAKLEGECFSLPKSENDIKNEVGKWLCAFVNGNFAGYVGFYTAFCECNITSLAVKKEFRKMGVGKALLDALSFPEIFLEVRKSNAAAIALYEKCGFFTIGERKGFYSHPKEDAVLMKKEK